MDVAYISALSALAGSFVGGLTSGVASWLSQRAQVRAGRLEHELSRREQLYKDFITSASKAYGDALGSNDPQIPVIVDLYAMISIMRVVSSPQTLACAEQVMHETTQALKGAEVEVAGCTGCPPAGVFALSADYAHLKFNDAVVQRRHTDVELRANLEVAQQVLAQVELHPHVG